MELTGRLSGAPGTDALRASSVMGTRADGRFSAPAGGGRQGATSLVTREALRAAARARRHRRLRHRDIASLSRMPGRLAAALIRDRPGVPFLAAAVASGDAEWVNALPRKPHRRTDV